MKAFTDRFETNFHRLNTFLAGLVAISILLKIGHGWAQPDRFERQVCIIGLYWAFVDVVWVFVFTSLYLLRA